MCCVGGKRKSRRRCRLLIIISLHLIPFDRVEMSINSDDRFLIFQHRSLHCAIRFNSFAKSRCPSSAPNVEIETMLSIVTGVVVLFFLRSTTARLRTRYEYIFFKGDQCKHIRFNFNLFCIATLSWNNEYAVAIAFIHDQMQYTSTHLPSFARIHCVLWNYV